MEIPIYNFSEPSKIELRVVKLNALTDYDSTKPHRHNYFEMFVFGKGDGEHEVDFVNFPIISNSIHIVAPGQVHQVRRELDTNGFVILFDLSLFESNHLVANFLFDHICLDVEEFSPTYHFTGENASEISRTIENIWKDFNSDNELKNEFVLSNLTLLCIHCLRNKRISDKPESITRDKHYINFRRLLKNNFKSVKKVSEYAQDLSLSEKQLNDVIQNRTGRSASQLIHQQIVLEAKRLLNTGMSAKETAYALNYEDPAHFSKFFKKQTGISPSEFQKVHA